MSGRWRNNFFDTHRTCQKPIESCCKPLRSGSSLPKQWLRVGGKDPEATVTKQECWPQCWGFKPEAIAFESIFLWHGQQDRFVPIAAARLLARKLPHCIAA